ncbi:MAG: HupE/UreJ family protein [Armatimonadetes bacterium]|nr:HupE/UreJ family protein [Armatimonadota bacterium]
MRTSGSKPLGRLLAVLGFMLAATLAWSHPMPKTAVMLKFRNDRIDAELLLPVVELKLGWDKPLPDDAEHTVSEYGLELKSYVADHICPVAPDGEPWSVVVHSVTPVPDTFPDVRVDLSMIPPKGQPVDRLTFNYDVIFHHLITHEAIISVVGDWRNGLISDKPVVLATMWDRTRSIEIDRSGGSWFRGFAATFRLGMRHIAEGTDHLLFLLALLLPAPLALGTKKWGEFVGAKVAIRKIVKVVSAFTVGHSITLLFGALQWVRVPEAPIEAAIALSIFVSAIHAFVPVFRGREMFVAGGFGLVHGLAFAATLNGFGFDALTLVTSIFSFNLGIETFQLFVIGLAMPIVILLARTRFYRFFRGVGATATAIASATWFGERAFGWSNPVSPVVERAAAHATWVLVSLLVVAVAANLFERSHRSALEPA